MLENVVLAALVAGASRRDAEARARDLLDLLGPARQGASSPAALSGGQRQRLAIARALANGRRCCSPTSRPARWTRDGAAEVLELFRRLHAGGQSILMVTHNPDVAAGAQRIVHLRDGVVAASSRRSRTGHPAAGPADSRPPRWSRLPPSSSSVGLDLLSGARAAGLALAADRGRAAGCRRRCRARHPRARREAGAGARRPRRRWPRWRPCSRLAGLRRPRARSAARRRRAGPRAAERAGRRSGRGARLRAGRGLA